MRTEQRTKQMNQVRRLCLKVLETIKVKWYENNHGRTYNENIAGWSQHEIRPTRLVLDRTRNGGFHDWEDSVKVLASFKKSKIPEFNQLIAIGVAMVEKEASDAEDAEVPEAEPEEYLSYQDPH